MMRREMRVTRDEIETMIMVETRTLREEEMIEWMIGMTREGEGMIGRMTDPGTEEMIDTQTERETEITIVRTEEKTEGHERRTTPWMSLADLLRTKVSSVKGSPERRAEIRIRWRRRGVKIEGGGVEMIVLTEEEEGKIEEEGMIALTEVGEMTEVGGMTEVGEEVVDMAEIVHVMSLVVVVMKDERTDLTKEMSLSEEEVMRWNEKKREAALTDLKLRLKTSLDQLNPSTDSLVKKH